MCRNRINKDPIPASNDRLCFAPHCICSEDCSEDASAACVPYDGTGDCVRERHPECDPATGYFADVSCLGTCVSATEAACAAFDAEWEAQAGDLLQAHRCGHGDIAAQAATSPAAPCSTPSAALHCPRPLHRMSCISLMPLCLYNVCRPSLAAELSEKGVDSELQKAKAARQLRACEAADEAGLCNAGQACSPDSRCTLLLTTCDQAAGVHRFVARSKYYIAAPNNL